MKPASRRVLALFLKYGNTHSNPTCTLGLNFWPQRITSVSCYELPSVTLTRIPTRQNTTDASIITATVTNGVWFVSTAASVATRMPILTNRHLLLNKRTGLFRLTE